MKRNRGIRASPSGYVLVIVLVIASVLAITGTGLLSLGVGTYRRAVYASQETAARSAAEAGAAKALFAMKSYSGGALPSATNESVPECSGTFSYTVTAGTPDGYAVDVTGQAGNVTKTIHARLTGQNSLFCGVALSQSALIKTSAQVRAATGSSNPKLLTNSTATGAINLEASTITFQGDVVVGPGGNPATVIVGEQVVSGTISAASATTTFPAVTAPTGLPLRSDITASTTLTEDARCGKIDLSGAGDVLTVSGDRTLYLTGSSSVQVDHSASINILAGSSLKLYVNGSVSANHATVAGADTDPRRMLIFGTSTCTSVRIENDAVFCGGVYAPQAAAELRSGAQIYGALACKKITTMEAQSKLYYDDRLREVQMAGGASSCSVSYWQDN